MKSKGNKWMQPKTSLAYDARVICNEFRQEIIEARSPEMLALAMKNIEQRIGILAAAIKRPDRGIRQYAREELRQLEELVSETRSTTNTNPNSLH